MNPSSPITTHVLDTSRGQPASGVVVTLEVRTPLDEWQCIGKETTNEDGRATSLIEHDKLSAGRYRLTFSTDAYFAALGIATFFPVIVVEFTTTSANQRYHIPLLLSPFGYSTYRGS